MTEKFFCHNRQNRCKKQARRDDEIEEALRGRKNLTFARHHAILVKL